MAEVTDVRTGPALQALHGFDPTFDNGHRNLVRHGSGDEFHHSEEHLAEAYERWPAECKWYDECQ